MNKLHLKYSLLLLCFFTFANSSVAQKDLDTLVIYGKGDYRPTIIDANKISENPAINDSTQKIPVKGYNINSRKINTGFDAEPITAAQMVGEPLTKLYNGLIKIGMGTYSTPYGEVWYNSLRSKEVNYGFRLKHLSSSSTLKDYGYAGFGNDQVSVYGKKFLKEHSLIGNFDYDRNAVHFYGYDAQKNALTKGATLQRFNYFAANAELLSHYTRLQRYNHDVKLSYYNLADLYKSSENNIKANGFVQTTIYNELFKVNGAVDFYNYKTEKDTTNNTIITLNPNFIATGDKYRASIGVSAVMDIFVRSKFYFYPNVDLSYNIFDDIIIPYVGASGGIQKNSFKSITDVNPFVLSQLNTINSNRKYELFGGLKGTLSSRIAYNARASYSSINNMLLYVNDTKDLLKNKFDVIYDDADVLNIRGEVSYQMREKLRINLRGEYFNYKMKTELRAWYKPQVEFTLSGNYNLKDKIVARVDLFYIDAQQAKTIVTDASSSTGQKVVAKELKGVFDANIGLEYRYTKKLGFFLNFNNIANSRYYRYSNYPTQKFSLMGGLSYSF
jgi:hypothetical protein